MSKPRPIEPYELRRYCFAFTCERCGAVKGVGNDPTLVDGECYFTASREGADTHWKNIRLAGRKKGLEIGWVHSSPDDEWDTEVVCPDCKAKES